MTKKILITLSIIALFASCTKASGNNSATHDEGVVINGVRWATRNVDAPGTFAKTPESWGMFFQWNRKKGWNTIDEEVEDWDSSFPTGTEWYAENDPCPQGWRVPTVDELRSLQNAGSIWTVQNGVNGRLFGTAPYQIFLPTVGLRCEHTGTLNLSVAGKRGWYWSSTAYMGAWLLWIDEFSGVDIGFILTGYSVRCVAID